MTPFPALTRRAETNPVQEPNGSERVAHSATNASHPRPSQPRERRSSSAQRGGRVDQAVPVAHIEAWWAEVAGRLFDSLLHSGGARPRSKPL